MKPPVKESRREEGADKRQREQTQQKGRGEGGKTYSKEEKEEAPLHAHRILSPTYRVEV